uniref:Putative ovule protein n=1 Tax=Solanum chacoense TaxID=4108 RepID=A0A0V0GSW7_SOLCH
MSGSRVRYTAMTSRTEDIYFPFFFFGVSNYSSRHDLEVCIHRHRSAIDIIQTTKVLRNVNDHYCFHKIKVHQSFQNLLLELNTIEVVQSLQ